MLRKQSTKSRIESGAPLAAMFRLVQRRTGRTLLLTTILLMLGGCAHMERYRAATERLGQRIDAVVTPAIESIGRSKIVTSTAGALDRFASSFDRDSRRTAHYDQDSELEPGSDPGRSVHNQTQAAIVVAESKCTNGASFNDETTTLSTIARLRLRSAPSIRAATIRIIEPGTIVTARRVSCGNWTEIVDRQKPIGFVFSAFLTAP